MIPFDGTHFCCLFVLTHMKSPILTKVVHLHHYVLGETLFPILIRWLVNRLSIPPLSLLILELIYRSHYPTLVIIGLGLFLLLVIIAKIPHFHIPLFLQLDLNLQLRLNIFTFQFNHLPYF